MRNKLLFKLIETFISYKLHFLPLHLPSSIHALALVRATLPAGLSSLTISLGCIITTNNDQILRPVIVLAREVALEDGLRTSRISLLRIDRRSAHVRHHGVSTAHDVLCVAERVVLWCWLREPDVTAVAVQVAGFEGVGDVFLDNDGTAGGVHEP